MAWMSKGDEMTEISAEEFINIAKNIAFRILNSHEPNRNIPDIFTESFEEER